MPNDKKPQQRNMVARHANLAGRAGAHHTRDKDVATGKTIRGEKHKKDFRRADFDEDLKPLTRSTARPGRPITKTNPDTGEKEFHGYRDYFPTGSKSAGDRKELSTAWAGAELVRKHNERMAKKRAEQEKRRRQGAGTVSSSNPGFKTSSSGDYTGPAGHRYKGRWGESVEEANRNQDSSWRDEADQEMSPEKDIGGNKWGGAPYFVAWGGQSHEWYGDDDPSTGHGRYKQKGDGGRVVAVNIPDYETAQKISNALDDKYRAGTFPDKSVYGKWGESGYLVDYSGAYILPMTKMDDYFKEVLPSWIKQGLVKDYGKQEMAENFDDNGGEEYNDEAGMLKINLHTMMRACKGLHELIGEDENLPEWVQEKVAQAKGMLVAAWDYMVSQHEEGKIYQEAMKSIKQGTYESKLAESLNKEIRKLK